MSAHHADAKTRAITYAENHGRVIRDQLGAGYDGIVFSTTGQSAIKALKYEELYQRERDIYLRLREHAVEILLDFSVPTMLHCDDQLWVIEMSVVQPPFVLDFAGAYLDEAPDYPVEVWNTWEAEKREQFGDRWAEVRELMACFRQIGIHLADVKPGNITFEEDET